jgi:hypothetical protein
MARFSGIGPFGNGVPVTRFTIWSRVYDHRTIHCQKFAHTLCDTCLAFIWFVILAPHKWPVGGTATLLIGLFITLALLVSIGMWWLFERNTDRVRRFLELSLFQRTELRERTKP